MPQSRPQSQSRPLARRQKVAIGFMIAWLMFWTAGILVVLFAVGAAVSTGEGAPTVFLVIWLAVAAFGLWAGVRKLRQLLRREPPSPRPAGSHAWRDDLPGR